MTVHEAVAELPALESQVTALKLSLMAEADVRRVAEETADTGTDAWAARLTGSTRAVMAGGIWLAKLLRERYDATREAFAAGGLDVDQVRVIVRAAQRIPDSVTDEERRVAEEALVAKAVAGMNARRLRQAARRMLEQLSAPRRWSRNNAGEPVSDPTVPGEGPGLNWSERLGAAFTELMEHLPAQGWGRPGMSVMVHVDHAHLLDGLAAAHLDTGTRISAGQARRLACDNEILPAVLGGESEVLDLGRERRLHTPAQRKALSLLYDCCAAQGCERPFAWCEIHHPHAWSLGGGTDLANGLPLCWHHHRRAHDDRFAMTLLPSGEARFRRVRRVA